MWQPQKCAFEKNTKLTKHGNFRFHHYRPKFCTESRNWLSYKDGYVQFEN